MKFDKRCKPWLLCDEDYRYSLEFVYLDGDYLFATNAHALVAIPIESRLARDVDGPIPPEALKAAVDAAEGEFAEAVCLKTKVKAAGNDYERPKDTKCPKWRSIMEPFATRPAFRIRFNAGLVKRMAHAMGTAGFLTPLALDVYADDAQVLARPDGQGAIPGVLGVVMPMREEQMWTPVPRAALPPERKKGKAS